MTQVFILSIFFIMASIGSSWRKRNVIENQEFQNKEQLYDENGIKPFFHTANITKGMKNQHSALSSSLSQSMRFEQRLEKSQLLLNTL